MSKPSETSAAGTTERHVGQEYFKQEVSKVCGGQCVVTGVKDHVPSIMIGSHIKPWSLSDDDEKLDGNNGLLLSPHTDKLFDRYLIIFSEDGKIIIAPELDVAVLAQWGIDVQKAYSISPQQQVYMKHHREEFKRKRLI
ncbi:HNH endonuclease [Photobacterium galatheae]|uniref:HNH nuclease domain-containing protein n=1 Tax=Photobacterium galatheae TaxID=1654360 RepID=A0A066RV09_9GAMM|nr:HNH endonuclease [Photobacterium galatheae]KDM91193.1 hypothetical protein EA58_13685 [Photobacterium galatheae]MCM0151742.1 HNH endonuclease [Photobacterium galatheae]